MYGLPQAGCLANKRSEEHLAPFSYYPTQYTPGLWMYDKKPIAFALWVDDFGIKYVSMIDVMHLKIY